MKTERVSINVYVAKALRELGKDRGGQALCVVLLLADEMEFVWPAELDENQIRNCEQAIVEALKEELVVPV